MNSYCHNCHQLDHAPITCRAKSVSGYQLIDLTPPINLNNPQTELEIEYAEALRIIQRLSSNSMPRSVKLIVNQDLETKYYNRKQEIERELRIVCEEDYYWHGSSHEIYMKIVQEGFKVPGVDPIPKRAFGIYTATNHSTSLGYRKNTNSLVLSKAIKGGAAGQAPTSAANMTICGQHSWTSGGIVVFFSSSQLLPKYIVDF